jgi:ATP-dependent exoDNAse (exonuclease V) alpha subunit
MAIYHLSVKPMSRKGGRSATAAIAYRTAEKIHDMTSDEVFDYTRKRGVEHTEIVLPTAAAKLDINWARDRQELWNAAEMAEKRKDARVAREYEVALPHELKAGSRVELVRAFAAELANRYGVAVDFAIHKPHRNGDERNHHAHIMTTTREITATGLGRKTDIELGDRDRGKKGLTSAAEEIESIRARWGALTNEHLKEQQLEIRVDHRSLQAQGIEREPTSHLGPAVSGMERRGMDTEVGRRLEVERAEAVQQKLENAAELVAVKAEQQQLRVSLLELAAMAPRQRERKVNPQTPERTADAAAQAARRIVDHLSELGPELRAFEPSRTARSAQPELSAQEKRDKLMAQLGKEPESAAATPATVPALDLEQIKAQGRDAAKRWAQEMAQQKARELERQREMERQRDLERSQNRGLRRGPGRDGPGRDGPGNDMGL